MISVTFDDYTPPARFAPQTNPWIGVEIEESVMQGGIGTLIDTIVFATPDADPANPQPRSFTTDNAIIPAGWYQFRWFDADGTKSPYVGWIQNSLTTDPAWKPSIRMVADHLYSRTKDRGGNYVGTFTSTTNPDSARVQHLIDVAQDHVIGDLGENPSDPKKQRNARHMVSLYTAMLIELGHYSEQVTRDISPYKELKKLYDSALSQLEDTTAPDDPQGAVNPLTGLPNYYFDGLAVGFKPW